MVLYVLVLYVLVPTSQPWCVTSTETIWLNHEGQDDCVSVTEGPDGIITAVHPLVTDASLHTPGQGVKTFDAF